MIKKMLTLVALSGALFALPATPSQATYAPRQYYSSWSYHTTHRYHYRTYYYKPTPTYVGYKHHYVIYHPSRPRYVHYYNPYKRTYWGRCPVKGDGKEQYSMLEEQHRKERLEDIKEEHFPKPGPMPKIPEAADDVKVDAPPDDLPTGEALPKAG